MCLACMEAEKENTESMALFLKLFNDVLHEITGNNNYKWKPHGMMCDESGANFQAISKVFGRKFLGHTVSCQWHFWQCAKCHVKDINVHEQETFISLFNEVCYALAANQFEKVSAALGNICVWNNIGNWWDWWHTRRFHIVPAYRGFNLPGINLAEIGHSTMWVPVLMSLAVAAWHDMCTMMLQDTEYNAFINNKAKVPGKGLNLKQRQKVRLQDAKFVDAALEVMNSGNIEAEAMIDIDPVRYFKPSQWAQHRVPQVYSSSNPQQKKKGCKRKRKKDPEYEYEFHMDEEYEGDETLSDETKSRNCILAEYDIVPAGIE